MFRRRNVKLFGEKFKLNVAFFWDIELTKLFENLYTYVRIKYVEVDPILLSSTALE